MLLVYICLKSEMTEASYLFFHNVLFSFLDTKKCLLEMCFYLSESGNLAAHVGPHISSIFILVKMVSSKFLLKILQIICFAS